MEKLYTQQCVQPLRGLNSEKTAHNIETGRYAKMFTAMLFIQGPLWAHWSLWSAHMSPWVPPPCPQSSHTPLCSLSWQCILFPLSAGSLVSARSQVDRGSLLVLASKQPVGTLRAQTLCLPSQYSFVIIHDLLHWQFLPPYWIIPRITGIYFSISKL